MSDTLHPLTAPLAPREILVLDTHDSLALEQTPASYVLQSGRVAVFALGLGGGLRRFLFHLGPGNALCGGARENRQSLPLLVVALEKTRLGRIPHAEIDCNWSPELRSLMSGWVRHLGAALAPLAPEDAGALISGSGGLIMDANERVQIGGSQMRWVRISGGQIRLLGLPSISLGADESPLLLAPGMWLEAVEDDVTLALSPADDISDGEALMLGLQNLQAVLLPAFEALEARVQDASTEMHEARERQDRILTAAALADLASLVDPGVAARPVEAPPLLTAARAVAEPLGVQLLPPSRAEDLDRLVEPFAAIARASGVRTRRVLLSHNWWHKDAGPLLGSSLSGEHPLALLPTAAGGYDCLDPLDGLRVPVDAQLAARLAPFATMIYRSFPDRVLKVWDVLKFALGGRRREVNHAVACGLVAAGLGLFAPQATGLLIDQAIPDSNRLLVLQLAFGLVATALGGAALQLGQGVALMRLESLADADTIAAVWDRLLGLPVAFFRRYTVGELNNRILAIGQVRQALGGATLRGIVVSLFTFVNLGLMVEISGALTLVALLLAGVLGATILAAGLFVLNLSERHRAAENGHAGLLLQLIMGVSKLRSSGAEARAFSHWAKFYRRNQAFEVTLSDVEGYVQVITELLPSVCTLVLFAVAVNSGLAGHDATGEAAGAAGSISTGAFLTFFAAFGAFFRGFGNLATTLVTALDGVNHWRMARPILEAEQEVHAGARDPGPLTGAWRLDNVRFRYHPEGEMLLDGVSLHAEPGEYIALVGPSGSGKSTLFRLLLGFETPETGSVTYDGKDLARLDIRAVRRQLGTVMQQGKLQAGTIYENIAAGALISHSEALQAAEAAGLASDIAEMPMGLHTVISEGGSTLSGGQRQRLMIARAMVQRPRILLLDEATSALDNRTQALVGASLKRLRVTRVAIAHRFSTIRDADRIYVLEAGKIVQAGTFDALMAEEGLFQRLASRQMV